MLPTLSKRDVCQSSKMKKNVCPFFCGGLAYFFSFSFCLDCFCFIAQDLKFIAKDAVRANQKKTKAKGKQSTLRQKRSESTIERVAPILKALVEDIMHTYNRATVTHGKCDTGKENWQGKRGEWGVLSRWKRNSLSLFSFLFLSFFSNYLCTMRYIHLRLHEWGNICHQLIYGLSLLACSTWYTRAAALAHHPLPLHTYISKWIFVLGK